MRKRTVVVRDAQWWMDTIAERCEVSSAGCWIWAGLLSKGGYAVLNKMKSDPPGPKTIRIAREVYRLMIGDVDDRLLICHRCDTPSCVNPLHVFPGTHLENMRDAGAKGRHARKADAAEHRQKQLAGTSPVKFLLVVPGDHLKAWQEHAARIGARSLTEWIRNTCNGIGLPLSKRDQLRLSDPPKMGRPPKPPES